jgi:hypothetical protein
MKNQKPISSLEVLFDQPGMCLDTVGILATVCVLAKLAATLVGVSMTLSPVNITLVLFMACWAILGDAAKLPLTAFREWCDDALRAPRFIPTEWANPSSLTGLAFKGVAEPNEQVVCDAVHAYLGRRLEAKESVAPIGQHEAMFSYETEEKLHQWKFSFNFRNGRDDVTGQPFIWITAAHVYEL